MDWRTVKMSCVENQSTKSSQDTLEKDWSGKRTWLDFKTHETKEFQ